MTDQLERREEPLSFTDGDDVTRSARHVDTQGAFMNISCLNGACAKAARALLCTATLLICATVVHAMEPTNAGASRAAESEQVATRIIVKYAAAESRLANRVDALNAADTLADLSGADIRHVRVMSGGAHVVEVAGMATFSSAEAKSAVASVVARIAADPAVEYAEIDAVMQIHQTANDPRFSDQWHYTAPGTGVDVLGGWANSTGDGVVVAVIDTGYRPHADLEANLLPGYDFISDASVENDDDPGRDSDALDPGDWTSTRDSSWHGTHVAGTVAAVTNNALDVAGVARDAKVLPVRALGTGGGFTSDIVDGMRWAAGLAVPGVPPNQNPAQVLNLSLGGSGSCGSTYQNAIDDIIDVGTTVVISAGNGDENASLASPGNCDGVITVAATTRAGGRAFYSNFGAAVEIAAPGGETIEDPTDGVLSTLNTGTTEPGDDTLAYYQGTSMAAPHVAGVAALLYAISPDISPAEVTTVLQESAQPFPSSVSNACDTDRCGAGIVDARAATEALTFFVNSCTGSPAGGSSIDISPSITSSLNLTNVSGTLTSLTPGVNVSLSTADWPNVTSGNTALPESPFRIVVADFGAACAAPVDFRLSVTSDQGNFVRTFSSDVGESPSTAVTIPESGVVQSSIEIEQDAALTDINVRVDLNHTWVGDLTITLTSPAGTEVELLNRPALSAGNAFGCEDDNMRVVFDDEASFDPAEHCNGDTPWLTGDVLPAASLSAFDGESSLGSWTLTIEDAESPDGGRLLDWALVTDPIVSCTICGASVIESEENTAPQLDSISNVTVEEGTSATVTLNGSDADTDDSLTLSLVSAPGYVSIADNGNGTGTLTIAPNIGDAGGSVTVRLSDGTLFDDETFVVTVSETPDEQVAPVLDSLSDIEVEEGSSRTVSLNGSDANTDDTLSLSLVSAPSYVTLSDDGDGTGTLTIAPDIGDSGGNVSVRLSDGVAFDEESFSITVTEIAPPGAGEQGCSHLYWRNAANTGDYCNAFPANTAFSTVFDNAFGDKSLFEVLNLNGSGLNALGRQTVAALLNACSSDIDYALSQLDVVDAFNNVFPGASGEYVVLKNTFKALNTQECPLPASPGGGNSDPTANDDDLTAIEGEVLNANVLANDDDEDAGDVLSVTAVNGSFANVGTQLNLASGATIIVNANGAMTYTPGDVGLDSISYSVSDGNGGSATADINVTVITQPSESERVTQSLLLLYAFDANGGDTVFDQSEVAPEIDLVIEDLDAVSWSGDGSLSVDAPTLIRSLDPATKLNTRLPAEGELTVEAWVEPTREIGTERIVSVSENNARRNVTLEQGGGGSSRGSRYDVRLRTSVTGKNGSKPFLRTPKDTADAGSLQHVVYTRNVAGEARIYVDGVLKNSAQIAGVMLDQWDETFGVVLANEMTGDKPWLGRFYLVAIYARALSAAEVTQNFAAGPDGDGTGLSE